MLSCCFSHPAAQLTASASVVVFTLSRTTCPQVVGGIYAHSLAIITDAAHLLSDVSGFAVAVLAAYWAKRRSQEHFSYGYHRVEVGAWDAAVVWVP